MNRHFSVVEEGGPPPEGAQPGPGGAVQPDAFMLHFQNRQLVERLRELRGQLSASEASVERLRREARGRHELAGMLEQEYQRLMDGLATLLPDADDEVASPELVRLLSDAGDELALADDDFFPQALQRQKERIREQLQGLAQPSRQFVQRFAQHFSRHGADAPGPPRTLQSAVVESRHAARQATLGWQAAEAELKEREAELKELRDELDRRSRRIEQLQRQKPADVPAPQESGESGVKRARTQDDDADAPAPPSKKESPDEPCFTAEDMDVLRQELEARQGELEKVRGELSRLTQQLDASLQKMVAPADEVVVKSAAYVALEARARGLAEQRDELRRQVSRAASEASSSLARQTSVREQVAAEVGRRLAPLQRELEEAQRTGDRLRRERDKLGFANDTLKVSQLHPRVLDELRATLERLDEEGARLRTLLQSQPSPASSGLGEEGALAAELAAVSDGYEELRATVVRQQKLLLDREAQVARLSQDRSLLRERDHLVLQDRQIRDAKCALLTQQAALHEAGLAEAKLLGEKQAARASALADRLKEVEAEQARLHSVVLDAQEREARQLAERNALSARLDTANSQLFEVRRQQMADAAAALSLEEKLRAVERRRGAGAEEPPQLLQRQMDEFRRMVKCSVCRNNNKDVALSRCVHCFCRSCIERLFSDRNRRCPLCKTPFDRQDVRSILLDA